jgi:hypothetical protein
LSSAIPTVAGPNTIITPGRNTGGTAIPTGAAAAIFATTASADSWFGSINFAKYPNNASGALMPFTDGRLVISNLNPAVKYNFTFFASRMVISDNRDTLYTVAGLNSGSDHLNPANNTSELATVADIFPTAAGQITLDVTAGPDNNQTNKFFYLGAMAISSTVPEPASMSLLLLGATCLGATRRPAPGKPLH